LPDNDNLCCVAESSLRNHYLHGKAKSPMSNHLRTSLGEFEHGGLRVICVFQAWRFIKDRGSFEQESSVVP